MRTFIAMAMAMSIAPGGAYAKSTNETMLDVVGNLELEYRAADICPNFTATLNEDDAGKFVDKMSDIIGYNKVYARLKKIDRLVAELIESGGVDAFCSLATHLQAERVG